MQIREISADDTRAVADVVQLANAAVKVDSPWEHELTHSGLAGRLRQGWDGEPPRCFAASAGGRLVAYGELSAGQWDNRHLAHVDVTVHPDERRRGFGSELLGHLLAEAGRLGRTSVTTSSWELPAPLRFAEAHGFEVRSRAVNRRQYVAELSPAERDRLHREAAGHAAAYDLLTIDGRTPPDLVDGVAELTAAINDAPMDDLEMEPEVFTAERVRAYEMANEVRRLRTYRTIAWHRETGALAGQTVVAVEHDRPEIGHQHDTSVLREHRGHRLGLLMKTGMLRWLARVEPQLRTIDTWNAESNGPMAAVNERLGYRVLARGLEYQRAL